ncbi:hypothetical protein FHL15_001189 [Xylaria flabelliformis]|uniref:Uncharacterized protein n=1 Tax=Xylaria flabelliformis TaxID=2512241 RepID=A0A553ICQ6_9PEZI|nr:hypothetical protein FHL15_001189 [Xylaria flabelliformis]
MANQITSLSANLPSNNTLDERYHEQIWPLSEGTDRSIPLESRFMTSNNFSNAGQDQHEVFPEDGGPEESVEEHTEKRTYRTALQRIGKLRAAILFCSTSSSIIALFFLGWLHRRSAHYSDRNINSGSRGDFDASCPLALRYKALGMFFRITRGRKGSACLVLLALALLLALVTMTLQFASTILFTDIRLGLLVGQSVSSTQMCGMSFNSSYENPFWNTNPTSTASFIEYSEPAISHDTIADTGVSIRGFLPIRNVTLRSRLRSYAGMASLFDTRVVYVRPRIEFTVFGAFNTNLTIQGLVNGDIEWLEQQSPGVFDNTALQGFEFDCTMQDYASIQLCYLRYPGLISRLRPKYTFKIINLSNVTNLPDITDVNHLPDASDEIRASLCYNAIDFTAGLNLIKTPHDYNVSFEISNILPPEPEFVPVNGASQRCDNFDIRRQLGATTSELSALDRGIIPFDIGPVDKQVISAKSNQPTQPFIWDSVSMGFWNFIEQEILYTEDAGNPYKLDVSRFTPLVTPVLTYCYCTKRKKFYLHSRDFLAMPLHLYIDAPDIFWMFRFNPILDSIFSDTLKETKNPAIAMQAFFTTVLRTIYYATLPYFDYDQEAVMRLAVPKQIPSGYRGFISVSSLVAAHIVLTYAAVVIFILKGRLLDLHNPWAVVMDVWTPEGHNFLEDEGDFARMFIEGEDDNRIVRLRDIRDIIA